MQSLTRRDFIKNSVNTLISFALLEKLFKYDLFAEPVRSITEKWLKDTNELCS
jgi:hypothetical protein